MALAKHLKKSVQLPEPYLGELHLEMHTAHALLREGWDKYLKVIVELLRHKLLVKNFKLALWNKHNDLLLIFVTASLTWIHNKYHAHAKKNSKLFSFLLILDLCNNNKTISFVDGSICVSVCLCE